MKPIIECEIYDYGINMFNYMDSDLRCSRLNDEIEVILVNTFYIYKNEIYNNVKIKDMLCYFHLSNDFKKNPILPVYFQSDAQMKTYLKKNKNIMNQYGKLGHDYTVGRAYLGTINDISSCKKRN
jgi:hypothetical protein